MLNCYIYDFSMIFILFICIYVECVSCRFVVLGLKNFWSDDLGVIVSYVLIESCICVKFVEK